MVNYSRVNNELINRMKFLDLEKTLWTKGFDNLPYHETHKIESAEKILSAFKDKPFTVYCDVHDIEETAAHYDNSMDTVTIPRMEYFRFPEHYYFILFHEYAHSTHHESRMKERAEYLSDHLFDFMFDPSFLAREEIIAETTALYLAVEAGINEPMMDNCTHYIKTWAGRLSGRSLQDLFSEAREVANYMMGTE